MTTEELLHLIVDVTEDFKAEDRTILKVEEVCDFADYFVICTGTSTRQIQSLAEELIIKCKHANNPAISREGITDGEWVLLDFGPIIVHLFLPEKREMYNLEELWQTGEEIKLERGA